MDEAIKSFALHCTLYCQGNTTLAKSQSLEIISVSGFTDIYSIRFISYHRKLADFGIQHGSDKIFSTVPQRSGERPFYTPPQGRCYTVFLTLA